MNGCMMHFNLNITSIMQHALTLYAEQEIVSLKSDGLNLHRYKYKDAFQRIAQFAHCLDQLDINENAKIGTMAWNSHQHFELHYAIPCTGRIYHTINPKLLPEQILQIINDAQNEMLIIDIENISLIESIYDEISRFVKYIIILGDVNAGLKAQFPFLFYEDLIRNQNKTYPWPEIAEERASGLCYSSGTTGQPKGVLYSHRSTVLHAMTMSMVEVVGLHSKNTIMPIVPLYHISAWDMPFNAVLCGAKIVWPHKYAGDTDKIIKLIQAEKVDIAVAVPTIWSSIKDGLLKKSYSNFSLKRAISGGSAAPIALIKSMQALGVCLENAWGMTETSSLGAINRAQFMGGYHLETEQAVIKCGRPIFGMQMRLRSLEGQVLEHDGYQEGILEIRGHTVAAHYINQHLSLNDTSKVSSENDGAEPSIWFDTGDIATIDTNGYMHITDRAKDMIKSGGEWISSVEVENAAMGFEHIYEAAVIAVEHEKWGERPLLIVVPKLDQKINSAELMNYLAQYLHKWSLPTGIVCVEEIPYTATGKVNKKLLREKYKNFFSQKNAV